MSAYQSVGTPQETARYRMTMELKAAVRHLRAAEDIARLEMSYPKLADRIREIYEHASEDVLNGKSTHTRWARLPI